MREPGEAPDVGRLKRRADFLRVGRGKRWHAKTMTVQSAPAEAGTTVRIGFTLTRKVGGAVVRNRVRRRLKEAIRLAERLPVEEGHDYVIVGRIDAARLPFDRLRSELLGAFTNLRNRPDKQRSDRTGPVPKSTHKSTPKSTETR